MLKSRETRRKSKQNEEEGKLRPKTQKLARSLSKRRMNAINRSNPNFKEELKNPLKKSSNNNDKIPITAKSSRNEKETAKSLKRPLSVRNIDRKEINNGLSKKPIGLKKGILSTKNLAINKPENNSGPMKNTHLLKDKDKIDKKNLKNIPDYQKFMNAISKKGKNTPELKTPSSNNNSNKKSPKIDLLKELEKNNNNQIIDKKKLKENKEESLKNKLNNEEEKLEKINEESKKNSLENNLVKIMFYNEKIFN